MPRSLPRSAVAVAAASLLAVGLAAVPAAAAEAAPPTELFISEYVEGSSNNKAIEIANLTDTPVDLGAGGYAIRMYFNGNPASALGIDLTGVVAPGDVFVLAQAAANATVLGQADQTSTASWFNGDDAIVLTRGGAAATVVDAFGQAGFDPGTEWGAALTSTADNTLRRGDASCTGDTNPGDVFDPSLQWVGFAQDTFDGLGAHTATCVESDPEPPTVADCELPVVTIGSVQGAGASTPVPGQTVRIEGVVVGDFQAPGSFGGYFLQDAGDGEAATSDGIFVLSPEAVAEGDVVHVVGTAAENFGLTRITAIDAEVCEAGVELPAATAFELPAAASVYEPLEGMRVTLPQSLTILEYFNFGRFGEITLGSERQMQPTAVHEPGSAEAIALAAANDLDSITLDDGRSSQNPDPAIHPSGEVFTLENTFRGGDLVANATGVLDFAFGLWRIQPTQGADFTAANPRPGVPEVGGNLTVASFNVLNYFTSIGTGDAFRGANTQEEFDRQEAKIVSAITEIDADVFGLIEIENNGTAVQVLVDAINEAIGSETYEALITGPLGTDAITNALIYKPAAVEPVGAYAKLDSTVDPKFRANNRPALAQTFADLASGEEVTVVVNHFKSKGSDCNTLGDPDTGDGQGNCNITRTMAAEALADWLADGPTGAEPGRELIIGDLNSYDKEDPIQALTGAGYTDLLLQEQGENAYSYVFDGQLGYLDYALAGTSLLRQVTGAAGWAINADEPSLIDYDMSFKRPAQDALFAPDPYRSSDHDPVIVGLDLIAPELAVTGDPTLVFPPDAKWHTVSFDIDASDDSGQVQVEIVEVTATGHKAHIREVSDTEVEVLARQGAVYTVAFKATDPSGNTTTAEVTITVAP